MAKNEVNNTIQDAAPAVLSSAPAAPEKVDHVDLVGRIFLEEREDFRTRKPKVSVIISVKNPFDEFEDDIEIMVSDASRRGKFEYRAKQELRKADKPEIPVSGTVALISFSDKVRREQNEYAAIEINNLFDDGVIFAKIPDKAVRAAFTMLAKERLIPKTRQ